MSGQRADNSVDLDWSKWNAKRGKLEAQPTPTPRMKAQVLQRRRKTMVAKAQDAWQRAKAAGDWVAAGVARREMERYGVAMGANMQTEDLEAAGRLVGEELARVGLRLDLDAASWAKWNAARKAARASARRAVEAHDSDTAEDEHAAAAASYRTAEAAGKAAGDDDGADEDAGAARAHEEAAVAHHAVVGLDYGPDPESAPTATRAERIETKSAAKAASQEALRTDPGDPVDPFDIDHVMRGPEVDTSHVAPKTTKPKPKPHGRWGVREWNEPRPR